MTSWDWPRLARHGYVVGAVAVVLLAGYTSGIDAEAYWSARFPDLYDAPGVIDSAFLYSPAFAQLIAPLTLLPLPVFLGLWAAFNLAAIRFLTGRWAIVAILLPPVMLEVNAGNIHLLLAGAIVVGFRYPAAWALVLLTKVTPGIGLLWFAVRREWRHLAIALGTTAAVAAISFLMVPGAWADWIGLLTARAGGGDQPIAIHIPLVPRLVAAAAVVTWGGLTDRRWTVPVASMIALPALFLNGSVMLLGAFCLAHREFEAEARRPGVAGVPVAAAVLPGAPGSSRPA